MRAFFFFCITLLETDLKVTFLLCQSVGNAALCAAKVLHYDLHVPLQSAITNAVSDVHPRTLVVLDADFPVGFFCAQLAKVCPVPNASAIK